MSVDVSWSSATHRMVSGDTRLNYADLGPQWEKAFTSP